MKTKSSLLLAGLLASTAVGFANERERVTVDQLPAATKRTLDAAKDKGPVKEIIRRTVDGKVVYDVEFEKPNALNPRLRIAEDGTIETRALSTTGAPVVVGAGDGTLPPDFVTAGTPYDARLTMDELPAAVKATVERVAAGREIADVDRETWKSRTVYEVEFKQKGRNEQIHVTEDGTLVSDDDKPTITAKGITGWFKGTQIEDTPAPVQATILREAQGREIVDIDQEGKKDNPVYEVQIRDMQKNTFQIHIASDGTILRDSRVKGSVTQY